MFTFKTKEKCQKERTVFFFATGRNLKRLTHESAPSFANTVWLLKLLKMPNILITLEGTSFTNSANINGHEQALIVFITANLYGRSAEFYTFSY